MTDKSARMRSISAVHNRSKGSRTRPMTFFSHIFFAGHSRLKLFIAGGANVMGAGSDSFRIGERNLKATAAWLGQNGFKVALSDVGGTINRTLHLEIATGTVKLKTPLANESYLLAA